MTQSNVTSKVVAISGPMHTFDREVPKNTIYVVGKSVTWLAGLRRGHFDGCLKFRAMVSDESDSRDHIDCIGVVAYLPTARELAALPLHPRAKVMIQLSEDYPPFYGYRLEEYLAPKARRLLRRLINGENVRCGIPALAGTDSENEVESDPENEVEVEDEDVPEESIVYSSGTALPAVFHGVNVKEVINSFVPLRHLENGSALLELLDENYRLVISRLHYLNAPFADNGEKQFLGLMVAILAGYRSTLPRIASSYVSKWACAKHTADILVEHARATVVAVSVEDASTRNTLMDKIAKLSKDATEFDIWSCLSA